MNGPSPPLEGFAEVTLQTKDPASLARFYCETFECEKISEESDRIWLAVGTHARLGLWTPGPKEFGDSGGRKVHFAFRVSPGRLDELHARLRSKSVALRGPVEHEGGDRSLYIEDPEGNVVEVWDFFNRGEGEHEGVAALAE